MSDSPSAFVQRLPIGEPIALPVGGIPDWEVFPFEGDVRVKVLEPPVLPEPPRDGEYGPDGCWGCANLEKDLLWSDENWMVRGLAEPGSLPATVLLCPRGHYDLVDLPADRAAEFGPMIQRVERAVLGLGGISRVHVNKWGDGSAHLHMWFFARPEGMLQFRGTCLPIWGDVLPPVPAEEWAETNRRIGAALAAEGGVAHS